MQKTTMALAFTLLLAGMAATTQPAFTAQPVLTGEICDSRVHQLTTQIQWYDNLHKAESEAQKEGKLIFWMHMLGHIDGAT